MVLKVFVQNTCPRCPQAKTLGEKLKAAGRQVVYYDISTVDGLAEANMYMVRSTPSLVLTDKEEEEVRGWRGQVPTIEEVQSAFQNAS